MSVTDDLLQKARTYATTFDKGHLPMPPALHVAIVACMDARLNPYGLLGLAEGDAHVIRNAGGVITDDERRRPDLRRPNESHTTCVGSRINSDSPGP